MHRSMGFWETPESTEDLLEQNPQIQAKSPGATSEILARNSLPVTAGREQPWDQRLWGWR